MDIYLNRRSNDNKYFSAMGQSAASDLYRVAEIVAGKHIRDYFIRARFLGEVKAFANANLHEISNAKSDAQCKAAINNIREESNNISTQGDRLTMGQAKIFLTVSMEKYNKELGYTIDAVGLALGAGQFFGGTMIFKGALESASLIGKVAGVYVMVSGFSSGKESYSKLVGDDDQNDFLKDTYVRIAKFMGFDKKIGLTAYHSMEIISSAYGVFRMSLKSNAWRLYKFIPSDFQMQVNRMSKALLTLKIIGAGNEMKLIFEMHSND
ncbi:MULTISPECIES: DUF4225 domain-containing protein [Erwiniaceae]|uniref:DUF4225 domain-containing protein n=1 Tax=Enterobacter agglomerans TaxID=549 RepID=A0ACC5RHY1_ENTAG|nr:MULTISPECIES: DUF4225 domain-containing protein [Erwiniaceae]MBK4724321.1 DUF4225 domain-containing protein [Pantoea agglomerans]MBP2154183.1 hypothetical protein [Erwinia rhapontici]